VPEDFYTTIAQDLMWVDELLTRFGRWADERPRRQSCGSLEGAYQSPARGNERREPGEMVMGALEAMRVQASLRQVPYEQRCVLHALYVRYRKPLALRMRLLGIAPEVCRQRHADGLRMFANAHKHGTVRPT